jgi:hypothetical protein
MRVFLARSSVNSSGGFYRLLPATRFSFEEPHCTFARDKVNKNPKTFWHAWLSPIRVSTEAAKSTGKQGRFCISASFDIRPDLTRFDLTSQCCEWYSSTTFEPNRFGMPGGGQRTDLLSVSFPIPCVTFRFGKRLSCGGLLGAYSGKGRLSHRCFREGHASGGARGRSRTPQFDGWQASDHYHG